MFVTPHSSKNIRGGMKSKDKLLLITDGRVSSWGRGLCLGNDVAVDA